MVEPLFEELRRVRPCRALPLPQLQDRKERSQIEVLGRPGPRFIEGLVAARRFSGVAGRTREARLVENGVAVAIGRDGEDLHPVSGSLSLDPDRLSRTAPEGRLP